MVLQIFFICNHVSSIYETKLELLVDGTLTFNNVDKKGTFFGVTQNRSDLKEVTVQRNMEDNDIQDIIYQIKVFFSAKKKSVLRSIKKGF